MELFAKIGNGRVYNQWTVVFGCCCSNSSLQAKLKSDGNGYGYALKAASDTISCFVDMFLHFFENANYLINRIIFN